jgi:hypothetical protein
MLLTIAIYKNIVIKTDFMKCRFYVILCVFYVQWCVCIFPSLLRSFYVVDVVT